MAGGSTSTTYKGYKLNINVDENNTKDRRIAWTLNVKKIIVDKQKADIYSFIGEMKQLYNSQIMPLINAKQNKIGFTRLFSRDSQALTNTATDVSVRQSAPTSDNVTLRIESGFVKGVTFKNAPRVVKIDVSAVVQNNATSGTANIYIDIYQGSNLLYSMGTGQIPARGFIPVSYSGLFYVNTTIGDEFTLKARTTNDPANAQINRIDVNYTDYDF